MNFMLAPGRACVASSGDFEPCFSHFERPEREAPPTDLARLLLGGVSTPAALGRWIHRPCHRTRHQATNRRRPRRP